MTDKTIPFSLNCPTSTSDDIIRLAHGGGGRLMQQLLRDLIVPTLGNTSLTSQHDAAVVEIGSKRCAFTTDSYVVRPRFFPGGDIGSLSINGTLNDLAMSGARPLWLSVGLIIEEGLSKTELQRVLNSMRTAADAAGVAIVTGDTKVVDRGAGDGLYINTSGIGIIEHAVDIHPRNVQAGDAVIVSGDLGRHGIAIMAARESLNFEPAIESDCADLSGLVRALLDAGVRPHCLRDITRGGLAAVLNEIAEAARCMIEIDELQIPLDEPVANACELLGLDPLHIPCEGRMAIFVAQNHVAHALEILRTHPLGKNSTRIGACAATKNPEVILRSRVGSTRILDLPAGELLPRIC